MKKKKTALHFHFQATMWFHWGSGQVDICICLICFLHIFSQCFISICWYFIWFYNHSFQLLLQTSNDSATYICCIKCANATYDRVSDVVGSCVRFANKILTHHRMHWHWPTIAHLKPNMPRIQNMYDMYRAKVDCLARKTDFLPKRA